MLILNLVNKRYRRIFTHFLFWFSYLLFFGSIYGKYGNNYYWYYIETSCMLPFIMAATYTTIYGILPFYLKKRKLAITLLLLISVLFLATLGERILLRIINGLPITKDNIFGVTFLYLFLETNFMVGIAFAIKVVKKWLTQQEEKHEVEKQSLKSELNLLKAQLNPHFLFNTMNNLYSLSLEESSKTSEGIAKTANLLRSVLYECNESEIPLEKEITLIENYIELEKMRCEKGVQVIFTTEGLLKGHTIAPMLLFTFVENCFKHGLRSGSNPSEIKISVKALQKGIIFNTENAKVEVPEKTDVNAGGIGLKNARKRLEIIYPKNHQLKISDDNKTYKVHLEIWNK